MKSFGNWLRSKFARVINYREMMHEYQHKAVQFLHDHPYCALFVDMGLGKTVIVLTFIADLFDRLAVNKVLVLGPIRVVNQTWPNEIGEWNHTACLSYAVIRDDEFKEAVRKAGSRARAPIAAEARQEAIRRGLDSDLDPKATLAVVNEFLTLKENANKIKRARVMAARKAIREADRRNPALIHLVNIEQTEMLVAAWGDEWPYDLVVVDESSGVKDHQTKRFKALKRIRPLVKWFIELTATPAAEGYMGLFAQFYLLDLGQRLGRTITYFRDRYFNKNYNGYGYKLRPGADDDITKAIADICLTLKKADYSDVVEPIKTVRPVLLTKEQMAAYKEFTKESVFTAPDGTEIEAASAANLSSKALQLASGAIYDADRKTHAVHDHKIDELRQIVEESCGKPLMVAYWFKSSLARLKAAFPDAVVMDTQGKAVGPWNKGKIKMLLCHPRGTGHGLNMQHGGHNLIFFDIPWSYEVYFQLIGRLDRQGQKNPVTVQHIVAKGTADEDAMETLRTKGNTQDLFFRFLKRIGVLTPEFERELESVTDEEYDYEDF